jgi:hypothetical protein
LTGKTRFHIFNPVKIILIIFIEKQASSQAIRIISRRFGAKYFKPAANFKEKECPVFSK